MLPGVKIECIHTKSVFVWMHSILTPGALYFDPKGLFSNLKKAINHNFKRDLKFLKKPYILYSYCFKVKVIFKLGNPFKLNDRFNLIY